MKHLFTGPEAHFTILSVAILLIGAAIWAAVVFGIARRYAFSRKQTFWWTVGGLLLGPVGLLTLPALREWPARIACASCGHKRVVDRERCERCGAGLPVPQPTGTEIYDPAPQVGAVAAS